MTAARRSAGLGRRAAPLLALPLVFALLRLMVPPGAETIAVDGGLGSALTVRLAGMLAFWPGPNGPSGADGIAILAALATAALVAPWSSARAAAGPAIALGALAGPGTALLTLLSVALWRGFRHAEGRSLSGRNGVGGLAVMGIALALMPLVHGAGAALVVALAPVLALTLPAPLIVGQALAGVALILGFPLAVAAAGHGFACLVHGCQILAPVAGLLGLTSAGVGDWPRAMAAGGAVALPAVVAGLGRRRAAPAALFGLTPVAAALIHGLGGGDPTPALMVAPAIAMVAAAGIEGRRTARVVALLTAVGAILLMVEPSWTSS
ncbi:hypothetical protein L2U69_13660 [Zavarzinia compransoris]|uniref:hypothetical protein n=1 Tax=Zavarzinia marina TaxID=2911065 RepID=UPI001F263CCB|nr:hypothetical protein [Zavarzinia marina]MCF4166694.1 hypothetical protein [Zavarzinia marina]